MPRSDARGAQAAVGVADVQGVPHSGRTYIFRRRAGWLLPGHVQETTPEPARTNRATSTLQPWPGHTARIRTCRTSRRWSADTSRRSGRASPPPSSEHRRRTWGTLPSASWPSSRRITLRASCQPSAGTRASYCAAEPACVVSETPHDSPSRWSSSRHACAFVRRQRAVEVTRRGPAPPAILTVPDRRVRSVAARASSPQESWPRRGDRVSPEQ
jgi:hypothetical protein